MPPFAGAAEWLNSEPLGLAELRGRVVVVNFWTLTCINWLRQEPYVRAWSQAYRDDGLIVIGVHTPEFSFEHEIDAYPTRSRRERSTIRSRSTTITRSGARSITTTGRRSTSSSSFCGSQQTDIRHARSSAAPGGAAFAPRDAPLAETEHFIILIMNASYHWVHVGRSRSASGTWSTSGGALRKLLANPSHWDTYTSSRHEVSPGVHGQCRLDALSPELFEPVESATAQSHLDQ